MGRLVRSKQTIMEYIENAREEQIAEILLAIMRRQEKSFPDHEMVVCSIPRCNRMKREEILEGMKQFLMKHCGDVGRP